MKSTRLPNEIIIVNDSGTPDLLEMIKAVPHSDEVKVIYAFIEEDILWNYNGACNLGVWLSTGDIIAIEDTDHIPAPEVYERGIQAFQKNPDVDRVAFTRKIVQIKSLDDPMDCWEVTGTLGANQMVAMMRRDAMLRLKGQDERFAGSYGYMAYDFPYRRDTILGVKSIKENYYWAVFGDEGEPGLKRGLSKKNRNIYKQNVAANKLHSAHGILNFHYTFERI